MIYEYLCSDHMKDAPSEDIDGVEVVWKRIGDDDPTDWWCEHPDHDPDPTKGASAAEWTSFTAAQIAFVTEAERQASDKLDEVLAILKANDPAVTVTFKTSSQPKGGDGVEIRVTSAATAGDLADTVDMAAEGFRRAKGLIREINDMQLGVDLEASIKAVEAVTNGRPEAGLKEPY